MARGKIALTQAQKRAERERQNRERTRQLVRNIMGANGMTQEELGLILDMSAANVSHKLTGKRGFTVMDLIWICDTFHLDRATRAAMLGAKEKCVWEKLVE